MTETAKGPRRLDRAQWPALTDFFRGYLHQDAATDHASPAAAFDAFWGDADDEERQRFLREWGALTTQLEGKAWGRVRQTLQRLGAVWLPGRQAGVSALQRAVHRQNRVP